jgi:3-phenylpropionate/trans-cinnamate dioxygenase ferredoxin reductase subunit
VSIVAGKSHPLAHEGREGAKPDRLVVAECRLTVAGSAAEDRAWLDRLRAQGTVREEAVARLHELLLRAARFEVARRRAALPDLRGDELEDIALESAGDALMAVLAKLDSFSEASRFTTWACKFAVLEAAIRLRRRVWRGREVPLESEGWSLFEHPGATPEEEAERSEILVALERAIATALTPRQREVLGALALGGVPIDVLAERLGATRDALYQTLHDARRSLRGELAEAVLDPELRPSAQRASGRKHRRPVVATEVRTRAPGTPTDYLRTPAQATAKEPRPTPWGHAPGELMPDNPTFIIVGAGSAGAKAAQTLREEGFDGRVVLIGAEPQRPYERPPLSKEYLRGEWDRERVFVHPESFYADHDVELRTSTVVRAIDVGVSEVALDDERLRYDRLLLATGSEPRRLTVPGADLEGILYLRDVGDADAIRARMEAGARVVIVGGGWIGMEVAASARQRGLDVTVLDHASVPFARVLGPKVGAFYRDLHRDHGIELLGETPLHSFEGKGAVDGVVTAGGRRIPCDFVVVGIGVVPRIELARAAGIPVGDGILVDARLETSVPGIFAAGDVAAARHPLYDGRVRVEHAQNALDQGPAAARGMLGARIPYDRIPYFYSDQYDVGMEYSGHAPTWDRVVFRGDPATREFIAFWLAGDRVVAGTNVNVWDVREPIEALIRERAPVDDDRLRDPDVPLQQIASARPRPARGGMGRLERLREAGVSIWLDTLSRDLLETGDFSELVGRCGVTGATTNPTIFAKAITASSRYDAQLRVAAAGAGHDARELFFELALEDVRRAAEVLRPVHESTSGRDGLVSFECTPDLADDADATVAQAVWLRDRLDLSNVMIKVPATAAGVFAIEELTARGVNVNVTLLFSLERHEQVMEAYLTGLERRVLAGKPIGRVCSVASFFVSRVDAKADARLPAGSPVRGRVAVANAQLAYANYLARFSGPRWEVLRKRGATPQRPLWASTGTKDPSYSDVLYVEALIAPGVINTMPERTLRAFADHGDATGALDADATEARAVLALAAAAGVELGPIARELEREGVQAFSDSYDELLACVESKLARVARAAA